MLDDYEGVVWGLFEKTESIALVGGFETPVIIYTKGELLKNVGLDEEWDYENFVLKNQDQYCANVKNWDKSKVSFEA